MDNCGSNVSSHGVATKPSAHFYPGTSYYYAEGHFIRTENITDYNSCLSFCSEHADDDDHFCEIIQEMGEDEPELEEATFFVWTACKTAVLLYTAECTIMCCDIYNCLGGTPQSYIPPRRRKTARFQNPHSAHDLTEDYQMKTTISRRAFHAGALSLGPRAYSLRQHSARQLRRTE